MKKTRIFYLIKEDKEEYSRILSTLENRLEALNNWVDGKEMEIKRVQRELKNLTESLNDYIQEREEIIETLKKLGLISKKKIIGDLNISPSERISLDNPIIELITEKERWKEIEEEEKRSKNASKENKSKS